ncbi:MAG: hypothetical protein ACOH2R_19005 [Pseudomonas sp.]
MYRIQCEPKETWEYMVQSSESLILGLIKNENNFKRIFLEKKNHGCTVQLSPNELAHIASKTIHNPTKINQISVSQFHKVKLHFQLLWMCEKKYGIISKVVELFESEVIQAGHCSAQVQDWLNASQLISADISALEIDCNDKTKNLAQATLSLRKKGLKVDIVQGEVELPISSYSEILNRIDFRARQLGHNLFLFMIHHIELECYMPQHERYYFRKELRIINNHATPPLGYLYQLSLTHLEKKEKTRITSQQIIEIFELSRDLMTLLDFQRVDYMEGFMNKPHELLPYLRKSILHDQLFTIDQMSKRDAMALIEGLFCDEPELLVYIDIFRALSAHPDRASITFHKDSILKKLRSLHSQEDISKAIDDLSFSSTDINNNYLEPLEIEKLNYFQRPFIKRRNDYLYPHPCFGYLGFIFTLFKKTKEKYEKIYSNEKKLASKLGKKSELLIERLLTQQNIEFISGKKYKVPKYFFSEIGSTALSGECDYIVEGENHILFIELKSKTLTAESRKGGIRSALLDLTQSLLSSLEQSGRHEYTIRKHGFLEFDDGTRIELGNRKIEKISLTVFDFNSLSDINLVQDILGFLPDFKFHSEDPDEAKIEYKINEVLQKLKHQQNCSIFTKEYRTPYGRTINFNNRFFSAGQLIIMLKNSKSTEHFIENINSTRQTGNSTKDWYFIFNNFALNFSRKKTS